MTTIIENSFSQVSISSNPAVADALEVIFRSVWSSLAPYLSYFLFAFLFLFIIATIKFFVFGRWDMMGSLIYKAFYFGILLAIIAIEGVGILLNPIFDLIFAFLYPVSYWLTGRILRQMGAKI